MRIRIAAVLASTGLLVASAAGAAESVLFNFDNARQYAPLPISLTVGGITADLSATMQGYSIQAVGVQGISPAGFSGLCVYPSSVFASDLLVHFSCQLTDFSILYAPEELACDSSATMRVTAYRDATFVGTTTTNAYPPGTWPSATLAISAPEGFNHVVVHYDAAPVTGGDYGPVFMADNMLVTPGPPPILLGQAARLADGSFQFSFSNTPARAFTVLGSTNLSWALSNWTVLGPMTETSAGQFTFIDLNATNNVQRFYRVSSP